MVQKRIATFFFSGKYYFYDSKPKAVPILRYIIGIMILIAASFQIILYRIMKKSYISIIIFHAVIQANLGRKPL